MKIHHIIGKGYMNNSVMIFPKISGGFSYSLVLSSEKVFNKLFLDDLLP